MTDKEARGLVNIFHGRWKDTRSCNVVSGAMDARDDRFSELTGEGRQMLEQLRPFDYAESTRLFWKWCLTDGYKTPGDFLGFLRGTPSAKAVTKKRGYPTTESLEEMGFRHKEICELGQVQGCLRLRNKDGKAISAVFDIVQEYRGTYLVSPGTLASADALKHLPKETTDRLRAEWNLAHKQKKMKRMDYLDACRWIKKRRESDA